MALSSLWKSTMLFLWTIISMLQFYDLKTNSASKKVNNVTVVYISYTTQKWYDLVANYNKNIVLLGKWHLLIFFNRQSLEFLHVLRIFVCINEQKLINKSFNMQNLAEKISCNIKLFRHVPCKYIRWSEESKFQMTVFRLNIEWPI